MERSQSASCALTGCPGVSAGPESVAPVVEVMPVAIRLFGERFTANAAVLAVAAAAFAVMCAAVVLLTQTAPATMKAGTGNDGEGSGQHGAAGRSDQRARPCAGRRPNRLMLRWLKTRRGER